MNNKSLLIATTAIALCLSTKLYAQAPPEIEADSKHEQVGATMWRRRPRNSPYEAWFEEAQQRMPTFTGLIIQDARTEPLEPWDDMGVDGLYIKMADYQITDGWILEIPAQGQTTPQRHMFEAGIYFFGGPGHVIIQQEEMRPQRIDFKYRTLFSIPLNVRYQIFNDSDEPVRLVAVTSFPFVLNSELDEYDRRGKGTTNTHWTMSGNTMIDLHVSEMPSKVYKKAHRHSSDAFILLLSGEGYSLTWPEGRYEDRVRVDWHEGTMFVPPIYWYHQHLNPGLESARYLAINAPKLVINLGLRFDDQLDPDLPQIRAEFDAEAAE
jgi:uncharacterized RmlC-like cupin family protein